LEISSKFNANIIPPIQVGCCLLHLEVKVAVFAFQARLVNISRGLFPLGMGLEKALNMDDVVEDFVKGSGPGGQKINKVRNCVVLTHKPTGIQVRCQDSRSLEVNRGKARKLLMLKVEHFLTPDHSKIGKKIAKAQKKKRRSKSRSKEKYSTATKLELL
jgi:protein subunit release factor B